MVDETKNVTIDSVKNTFIGPSESESSQNEPLPRPKRVRYVDPTLQPKTPDPVKTDAILTTKSFDRTFPFASAVFKELGRRLVGANSRSITCFVPLVLLFILLGFVKVTLGQSTDMRISKNIPVINRDIIDHHTEIWAQQYALCETSVDAHRLLVDVSKTHTRHQLAALENVERSDKNVDLILQAWQGYRRNSYSPGAAMLDIMKNDEYKQTIMAVMSKHIIEHAWVEHTYTKRSLGEEFTDYATQWLGKANLSATQLTTIVSDTVNQTLNLLPENASKESLALVPYTDSPLSTYVNAQIEGAEQYNELAKEVYALLRSFMVSATKSNPTLYEGVVDDIGFVINSIDKFRQSSEDLARLKTIENIRNEILEDVNFEFSPIAYNFDKFFEERTKSSLPNLSERLSDPNFVKLYGKILIEYIQSPQYWSMELNYDMEDAGQIYDLSVWLKNTKTKSLPELIAKSKDIFRESKRKQQEENTQFLDLHRANAQGLIEKNYWAFHSWMSSKIETFGSYFEGPYMKYIPVALFGVSEVLDYLPIQYESATQSSSQTEMALLAATATIQLGSRIVSTLYAFSAVTSFVQHLYSYQPNTITEHLALKNSIAPDNRTFSELSLAEMKDYAIYGAGIIGGVATTGVTLYCHQYVFQKSREILGHYGDFRNGMVWGSLGVVALNQRNDELIRVPAPKRTYLINEIKRISQQNEDVDQIFPALITMLRQSAPALAEHVKSTYNAWMWKEADNALLRLINVTFENRNIEFETFRKSRFSMEKIYDDILKQSRVFPNMDNLDAEYAELKELKNKLEAKAAETKGKKEKMATETTAPMSPTQPAALESNFN
jgi:hypothetical protein